MSTLSYLRIAVPLVCLATYQGVYADTADTDSGQAVSVATPEPGSRAMERAAVGTLQQMPKRSSVQDIQALLRVAEAETRQLEKQQGRSGSSNLLDMSAMSRAAVEIMQSDPVSDQYDMSQAILSAAEAQLRQQNVNMPMSTATREVSPRVEPQIAGETAAVQPDILLAAVEALLQPREISSSLSMRERPNTRQILKAAESAIRGDRLLTRYEQSDALLNAATKIARRSALASNKPPSAILAMNQAAEMEIMRLNRPQAKDHRIELIEAVSTVASGSDVVQVAPVLENEIGGASPELIEEIRQLQEQLAIIKAQHQSLVRAYQKRRAEAAVRLGNKQNLVPGPNSKPQTISLAGKAVPDSDVIALGESTEITEEPVAAVNSAEPMDTPIDGEAGGDLGQKIKALYQDLLPQDFVGSNDAGVDASTEEQVASNYTVKKGDTLFSISRQLYGDENKYIQIYTANRALLQSYDDLRVGQILVIPPK